MKNNIVIAIDGPAGSGKSTLAKLIAERVNITYLDTGAMYRAITYLALKDNVVQDKNAIINIAKNVELELISENGVNKVFANNAEITKEIRTLEVNSNVSEVSTIKEVREEMVNLQRKIGSGTSIVAEGRDVTTVVFPAADLKLFMVASIEARTDRRHKEFIEKGLSGTSGEIQENLKKRDKIDSGREVSPLRKADDAIELDTTKMTIEEEIQFVINLLKEKNLIPS